MLFESFVIFDGLAHLRDASTEVVAVGPDIPVDDFFADLLAGIPVIALGELLEERSSCDAIDIARAMRFKEVLVGCVNGKREAHLDTLREHFA